MKKYFITLLLATVLAVPAVAQFRYGVQAGLDITSLNFRQKLFTVDSSVGYSAGLFSELMFPGVGFGIDFSLRYEQRGATMHLGEKEIWASQGYGNTRSYLHYLDLPIHLRFKYTNMNGLEEFFAPFIFAGPNFGFIIAHNKVPALKYASGDIGITVGIGCEIMRHWQVSFSRTFGMTYAVKTVLLTDMSARSYSWDLRCAYLF
ncbi:MAG: PorT family protein [Muribaculaceae bacterium]|mgnify:CR=1 FL=1|nr:PorT family protein [Muribaculaceae bacterium]